MKSLDLILITAVIGLFLFGFIGVLCGPSGCCLAEVLNGMACPIGNPLTSADFHFSVSRIFAHASVSGSFLVSLISFLASAICVAFLHQTRVSVSNFAFSSSLLDFQPENGALGGAHILSWLSLLEKRDPAYCA